MLDFADTSLSYKTIPVAVSISPWAYVLDVSESTDFVTVKQQGKGLAGVSRPTFNKTFSNIRKGHLASTKWDVVSTDKILSEPTINTIIGNCKSLSVLVKVNKRLITLKDYAEDEGDNYCIKSERALKSFINTNKILKSPLVALMDNGNLRAIWRGSDGNQIGIQFLEEGRVQFVFLVQRPMEENPSSYFGQETTYDIISTIKNIGLSNLMHG